MELTCDACQATIQIPDERVPPNATFRVTCPRCKQRIMASSIRPEPMGNRTGEVSSTAQPPPATPPRVDTSKEFPEEADEDFPPGLPIALVCMDDADICTSIKATLEGMGYVVNTPPTPENALRRLRFRQYSLVVLDDTFGGTSPSLVARYLTPLNMNLRRDIFVILVGERFKTSDQLMAFANSMNLVLHPADLSQLSEILKGAKAEHERFYKLFNECLIATGKKA